tara:strand:+ start:71 stop:409 length:339 start_codon:yes stop_codon:yes gene_type:complete
MKALLVVTMLGLGEPSTTVTTEYSSWDACTAARLQVMAQIMPVHREKEEWFDVDLAVQALCIPKEQPPEKRQVDQQKVQKLFFAFITKLMELHNDSGTSVDTKEQPAEKAGR